MKKLSPKAIRLLRKVAKHILAEPRRYDQDTYGSASEKSPCGTAACIAGWCDILSREPRPSRAFLAAWRASDSACGSDIARRAAKAIGMNVWDMTDSLFSGVPSAHWPAPFDARWRKATTKRQRARIAAARIEHFIMTDGAE